MTTILITGGTGSLGNALVHELFVNKNKYTFKKVIVLSRDELKQANMAEKYQALGFNNLQFFLGDVRDSERLVRAFHNVDVVIHAAALKRVDKVCFDPLEVKLTNVDGTQNVLDAAMKVGVKRVLVISSDKACCPTNVYGSSKMLAEHLTVAFNTYSFPRGTRCSVVRYGNVFGSRGSVIEVWNKLSKEKAPYLPVTNLTATRFLLSLDSAVQLVLFHALQRMQGGEIFVPVLPSVRISDLIEAYGYKNKHLLIGMRPGGEKLHEMMMTAEEMGRATINTTSAFLKGIFTIYPHVSPWKLDWYYGDEKMCQKLSDYTSDTNADFLTVDQLKVLLDSYKSSIE